MDVISLYAQLNKPSWAPPGWLFSPVWNVIYLIIIISFGRVFWLVRKKKLPRLTALPFILNIVFNAAFIPVQFVIRNNWLAAIDIILILGTLIWCMSAICARVRWIAYLQFPYLLWVTFAAALQLTIVRLNW